VVALLVEFGADVDAQDNNNMTPLLCAIESHRNLVAAQLLLDYGASIHL
jgi:ankyrin repeat protein